MHVDIHENFISIIDYGLNILHEKNV